MCCASRAFVKRTYFFIKNVMRINLCDVRPFYLNMELYYRGLGVIYLIFHFEEDAVT